jgi:hypothetical protein
LALREDATLALATLKQFTQPNEIFFCGNFWKLYQIKRNPDHNTQLALQRVLGTTSAELRGKFVGLHLRALSA